MATCANVVAQVSRARFGITASATGSQRFTLSCAPGVPRIDASSGSDAASNIAEDFLRLLPLQAGQTIDQEPAQVGQPGG
jgi:hypothetical protein